MKKTLLFVASVFALAAFASCNKAAEEPELVTYELTVDVTKDAVDTKGVSLSGNYLSSVWASGDVVVVYNSSNTKLGTLTPQSYGSASTTLKGSITTSGLSTGASLRLVTPRESWLYSGQNGTLEAISSKYSYAVANVTVTSVSGSDVVASNASFEPQQAIVKFELRTDSGAPVYPDELVISAAGGKLVRSFNASQQPLYGSLSIVPDDDTNVLYVAIRNENGSADDYSLEVTVGKRKYTAAKTGVTFQNGKYYTGKVTLSEEVDIYTVAGAPASVFGTEWSATTTSNDMTRLSDGSYYKKYTISADTDIAFKILKNHEWGDAGVNNWPVENYQISAAAGDVEIYFDPDTKNITCTYKKADTSNAVWTVAGAPASVFGTEWDVTNTANDMVKQSDGTFAKTYYNVASDTEMWFKVAKDHSWTTSYGQGGGNENVGFTPSQAGVAASTCTVTIHFDPNTHFVTATAI